MHLRERRHLHWVVGDEGWLNETALAGLAEYLIDELAFAHLVGVLYTVFLGYLANLVLAHLAQVIARLLLDSFQDGQTAVGCLEVHDIVAYFHLCGAVYSDGYLLQQLLGEAHHPVVVFVLYIELHAGELWVVAAVHTLVAEVTADLIYALKATYDEALEIQLCSDTHIHIHIQRVVVGDEWASGCATGYGLQHWGLHLGVTCLVKHLAHGAHDGSALEEHIFHAFVHHKVHIALAVALLRVVETIIGYAVLVFHDRQWLETLGEHSEFLSVYADLTHLGAEHEALDTDEVTYVEEFLEHHVIHLLLHGLWCLAFWGRGLYIIATHIYLDTTFGVLYLDERCLTHDAA